ncbi:MAG: GNAT family N-acetyltransferase [Oscillospiraceae bacterium]
MQRLYFRADESEFERIFEIMDISFPDNEMRTKEKQYELFTTNKHYNIFCIGDETEGILGFIVVWDLDELIFIENFATDENARGQGLGGELLNFVINKYQKDVILEVEPPEDEMKRRRVGFYQRHDFIYNEFDYLMPPLRNGDEFLPLKIMSYQRTFTSESFESYKKLIYKIVYEQ